VSVSSTRWTQDVTPFVVPRGEIALVTADLFTIALAMVAAVVSTIYEGSNRATCIDRAGRPHGRAAVAPRVARYKLWQRRP
jgi:hypothetical protein